MLAAQDFAEKYRQITCGDDPKTILGMCMWNMFTDNRWWHREPEAQTFEEVASEVASADITTMMDIDQIIYDFHQQSIAWAIEDVECVNELKQCIKPVARSFLDDTGNVSSPAKGSEWAVSTVRKILDSMENNIPVIPYMIMHSFHCLY